MKERKPLNATILITGAIVILYTVFGGYKAVSLTQSFQMLVVFIGLFAAGFVLIQELPDTMSFSKSWDLMAVYDRTKISFSCESFIFIEHQKKFVQSVSNLFCT